MSNICIDIEFLVGTSIKDAIDEAKELGKKLDVAYVKFEFNSVRFSVRPYSEYCFEDVEKDFHEKLSNGENKHIIV